MGNSASNANHPNHNRTQSQSHNQAQSPNRRSRPQSPPSRTSTTNRVTSPDTSPKPHPSLRTKKKSLELPDLASLALSPTSPSSSSSSHPWSRRQSHQSHQTSSPIPIPITPQTQHIPYANDPPQRGRKRGKKSSHDGGNFDSTQQMSEIPDVLIEPSTHIPIYGNQEDVRQGSRGRKGAKANPFIRGGALQSSSTRSFGPGAGANRGWRPTKDPHASTPIDASLSPRNGFVPETVHSTIPIALFKAEEEIHHEFDDDDDGDGEEIGTVRKQTTEDDSKEPIPTKIVWQGGGRKVVLARAGDDNWKGRLHMELEFPPDTLVWYAWIPLMPGTHHIRFIVDDQWRVADSLPTAVDDEGSLSNYVSVPMSGFTPPSSHPSPLAPMAPDAKHGQPSFWSLTSSTAEADLENPNSHLHRASTKRSHPVVPARWTSEFPAELIAAAAEEEAFLASEASSGGGELGVAAPNIPPAPVLPRHLDKLILNERKKEEKSSGSSASGRSAAREKEREERRQSRKHRSLLGMTSTTPTTMNPNPNTPSPASSATPPPSIPVTTPSGTEKKKSVITFGNGLSDDTSVLPVPSHVVLHHLSTSAIRNGVLAVGNTTRYRKKYLTTIYYKPT